MVHYPPSVNSNQTSTTQEEAKQDEVVDCIEKMDANQAYVTYYSETKGAGKKECIEMDANQLRCIKARVTI